MLVLEEDDEKDLDLGVASIYITAIAWTMVGIGALYFVMVRVNENHTVQCIPTSRCLLGIVVLRCDDPLSN